MFVRAVSHQAGRLRYNIAFAIQAWPASILIRIISAYEALCERGSSIFDLLNIRV